MLGIYENFYMELSVYHIQEILYIYIQEILHILYTGNPVTY